MSVIGIGTDFVNIKRIEKILNKNSKSFLKRILHKKEKLPRKISAEYVSKKFAAKEAFSKAIGTGIGTLINFSDINIDHDKFGKPVIKIDTKIKAKIFKKLKVKKANFFISLSDDYPFALATVVISK